MDSQELSEKSQRSERKFYLLAKKVKERTKDLQAKIKELEAIYEITKAINSSLELSEIFDIIASETSKIINFDRLTISLLDDFGENLQIFALVTKEDTKLGRWKRIPVDKSAAGWVVTNCQPLIKKDIENDYTFEEFQILHEEGIHSFISIPLISKEKVLGTLNLGSKQPASYSEKNVSILNEIAGQIAIAIDNARLLISERKKSSQLEMINEASRKAISTLDTETLFTSVTKVIQEKFEYLDVSLYLVDQHSNTLILQADSGAYSEESKKAASLNIGQGIVGWVAQTGETLLVNDVSKDSRYIQSFSKEKESRSELCVPIKLGDTVIGVINVESAWLNAFEPRDAEALETLADQMSQALKNLHLYNEALFLKESKEHIIATVPSALIVLDKTLNIISVNRSFCEQMRINKEKLEEKTIRDIFPRSFLDHSNLIDTIERVFTTHESLELNDIHCSLPNQQEKTVNIKVGYIETAPIPQVLLLIDDITERAKRLYELSTLRQIGEAMQGTFDLNRLLHVILTYVTAGCALGFSRAMVLLINKEEETLEGKMGVGPTNQEDANLIWSELSHDQRTLEDIVAEYNRLPEKYESPLHDTVSRIRIPLNNKSELVIQCIQEKKAFKVTDALNDPRISTEFRSILGANEFVIVPLIARDKALGVLITDNMYSWQPIADEQISLLTMFAIQAGLAIETATAYRNLEEKISELHTTQDKLVRSERLAAIGTMAAHVAHEIRNPLSTIGGFARRLLTSSQEKMVQGIANIIVEEVEHLEHMLVNILDYTRPGKPVCTLQDINEVLEKSCRLLNNEFREKKIALIKEFDYHIPRVMIDVPQIRQVFINLMKNAVTFMPKGGMLKISTNRNNHSVLVTIQDTGTGIASDVLDQIFVPFFSTREGGTGLGLTIVQKIVNEHGGQVKVKSQGEGKGTEFNIYLPIEEKEEGERSTYQK